MTTFLDALGVPVAASGAVAPIPRRGRRPAAHPFVAHAAGGAA